METARRQAQAVVRAADELRKVAPDAGTYVAESSFFERDWQRAYWGRNYPKLQQLKKKYDPGGCSSCITASAARNGAPTASPDWRDCAGGTGDQCHLARQSCHFHMSPPR
jgi:hypothetical protein